MYDPREAEKDFITLRIAALVLILGGCIVFAAWTVKDAISYGAIWISPMKATGEIVSYVELGRRSEITYVFTDHRGDLRQGTWLFVRPNAAAPCYSAALQAACDGYDIAIVYAGLFPRINRAVGAYASSADFFVFAGSVLIALFAFTFLIVMAFRYRQYSRESRYY